MKERQTEGEATNLLLLVSREDRNLLFRDVGPLKELLLPLHDGYSGFDKTGRKEFSQRTLEAAGKWEGTSPRRRAEEDSPRSAENQRTLLDRTGSGDSDESLSSSTRKNDDSRSCSPVGNETRDTSVQLEVSTSKRDETVWKRGEE